ncbi:hypothetical protein HNQ51_003067 [Inhella inkyongensis]|uniref:Nuclear transport factor 2 family protein n=1 Tax=Inhella inkyongensis TaxID=392593 RepID=A0A840SBL6_9BURK|nr:hypothetical protein [Inhella inkyongensis]MBB5205740.1 hypothetical protein [Inhella inkyongensis]
MTLGFKFSALLALTLCGVVAQAGSATPRAALQAFLQAELAGARLDSDGWRRLIANHVEAGSDYEEPGWDSVTLVRKAQIGRIQCSRGRECRAKVRFELEGADVHPADEQEDYVLHKGADGWRVATWPHAKPFGRPRVQSTAHLP